MPLAVAAGALIGATLGALIGALVLRAARARARARAQRDARARDLARASHPSTPPGQRFAYRLRAHLPAGGPPSPPTETTR